MSPDWGVLLGIIILVAMVVVVAMTTQDDWYTFQAGNNEHGITWQHAEDLNPEEINMLLAAHVLIVFGVFALLMIIGLVCSLVMWLLGVI